MPWMQVSGMDNLPAHALDRQRRDMIGGTASTRLFPWVRVQQAHLRPTSATQNKGRRAARPPRSGGAPRMAVCLAGAARALIHPLVWRSIARHLLGRHGAGGGAATASADGAGGHDLFAVLGTGPEDQRSRWRPTPTPCATGTPAPPRAHPRARLAASGLRAAPPPQDE